MKNYKIMMAVSISLLLIPLIAKPVFSEEDTIEQTCVALTNNQAEIDIMTDSVWSDCKELLSKIKTLIVKKSTYSSKKTLEKVNKSIRNFYGWTCKSVVDICTKDLDDDVFKQEDLRDLSASIGQKWKAFKQSMIDALQELNVEEQLKEENAELKKEVVDLKTAFANIEANQINDYEEKDVNIKKLEKNLTDFKNALTKYQVALVAGVVVFAGYELFKYCKNLE